MPKTKPEGIEVRGNSVALVGWHEGSAGQVHSWLERCSGLHVACFVHPEDHLPGIDPVKREVSQFSYPENGTFKGLPLICSTGWVSELRTLGISRVISTTSDPAQRGREIREAAAGGLTLENAIHESALVLPDAVIGKNVILHARALIGYRAELRDGVIVNTGSQVDHHNLLEENATLDPGVVFAGNVIVGRNAIVHTGVTVINRIRIGEGAEVGAGAVVIRDVAPGERVVGVPARPIGTKK